MGGNVTKAVIANAHTSRAGVALLLCNVSGAIHGNESLICPGMDKLNEELVGNGAKSAIRAWPSSDINTLYCKRPSRTEPRCKDKRTYPLHISVVQCETVQVTQPTCDPLDLYNIRGCSFKIATDVPKGEDQQIYYAQNHVHSLSSSTEKQSIQSDRIP